MNENLNKEKSNDMKNVLLVYDEQKKKVKVVKNLDKKGNLQTVEPTAENQNDFMLVNAHDSILTNFYKNFIEKIKHPVDGLNFFKSPFDQALTNAKDIQNAILVVNPTSEMVAMLEKFRIKDAGKPKAERQEQAESGHFYNENRIKIESLDKWGIPLDVLKGNGDYNRMLDGELSKNLYTINRNVEGVKINSEGKLRFTDNAGNMDLSFEGVKQKPDFGLPFYGHTFSEEDQKKLLETGNMGRAAELKFSDSDKPERGLISFDRDTNRFYKMKAANLHIADVIGGAKVTDENKQDLKEGKAVKINGMTNSEGKPITYPLQANAAVGKLRFLIGNKNSFRQEVGEDGKRKLYAKHIKGVPISEKKLEFLNNDGYLKLKDMKGKRRLFTSFVYWDEKNGLLKFPSKAEDIPKHKRPEETIKNNEVRKQEIENPKINKDIPAKSKKTTMKIH